MTTGIDVNRDGELERRDDENKIHGIHWLLYCALVGVPVGFLTSDSANAPGPDWVWEAIVVLTVGVILTATRVAKRRRRDEDATD